MPPEASEGSITVPSHVPRHSRSRLSAVSAGTTDLGSRRSTTCGVSATAYARYVENHEKTSSGRFDYAVGHTTSASGTVTLTGKYGGLSVTELLTRLDKGKGKKTGTRRLPPIRSYGEEFRMCLIELDHTFPHSLEIFCVPPITYNLLESSLDKDTNNTDGDATQLKIRPTSYSHALGNLVAAHRSGLWLWRSPGEITSRDETHYDPLPPPHLMLKTSTLQQHALLMGSAENTGGGHTETLFPGAMTCVETSPNDPGVVAVGLDCAAVAIIDTAKLLDEWEEPEKEEELIFSAPTTYRSPNVDVDSRRQSRNRLLRGLQTPQPDQTESRAEKVKSQVWNRIRNILEPKADDKVPPHTYDWRRQSISNAVCTVRLPVAPQFSSEKVTCLAYPNSRPTSGSESVGIQDQLLAVGCGCQVFVIDFRHEADLHQRPLVLYASPMSTLGHHMFRTVCLDWSPMGFILASGHEGGILKLWDIRQVANAFTLTVEKQHSEYGDLQSEVSEYDTNLFVESKVNKLYPTYSSWVSSKRPTATESKPSGGDDTDAHLDRDHILATHLQSAASRVVLSTEKSNDASNKHHDSVVVVEMSDAPVTSIKWIPWSRGILVAAQKCGRLQVWSGAWGAGRHLSTVQTHGEITCMCLFPADRRLIVGHAIKADLWAPLAYGGSTMPYSYSSANSRGNPEDEFGDVTIWSLFNVGGAFDSFRSGGVTVENDGYGYRSSTYDDNDDGEPVLSEKSRVTCGTRVVDVCCDSTKKIILATCASLPALPLTMYAGGYVRELAVEEAQSRTPSAGVSTHSMGVAYSTGGKSAPTVSVSNRLGETIFSSSGEGHMRERTSSENTDARRTRESPKSDGGGSFIDGPVDLNEERPTHARRPNTNRLAP